MSWCLLLFHFHFDLYLWNLDWLWLLVISGSFLFDFLHFLTRFLLVLFVRQYTCREIHVNVLISKKIQSVPLPPVIWLPWHMYELRWIGLTHQLDIIVPDPYSSWLRSSHKNSFLGYRWLRLTSGFGHDWVPYVCCRKINIKLLEFKSIKTLQTTSIAHEHFGFRIL